MSDKKTPKTKNTVRRLCALLTGAVLVLSLCACSSSSSGENTDSDSLYVWAINSSSDALIREDYTGPSDGDSELLDGLVAALSEEPEDEDAKPLLSGGVTILSKTLRGGILTLNFSSDYEKMKATEEVLVRAGVVRTLVQSDSVNGVAFTVDGKEAVTPGGMTIGTMNADSFVEDSGRQINTILNQTIRLYYADSTGKALHTEGRSIYYSASKPLEWAIVERVIAGPKEEGNYATVPSNTQIISVTSANGICYVNLSSSFIDSALPIDPAITIYSLVDSLVDDCEGVDMVQISVEGESSIRFRDAIDLSKPLKADLSYVETTDSGEESASSAAASQPESAAEKAESAARAALSGASASAQSDTQSGAASAPAS